MGHRISYSWFNGLGVALVACDDCNYSEWFAFEDGPEEFQELLEWVTNDDHANWNWVRPVPK